MVKERTNKPVHASVPVYLFVSKSFKEEALENLQKGTYYKVETNKD